MDLTFGIVIVLLGIFVCIIMLPAIFLVIHNKNVKEETVYEFTQELIDSDYPDTKFFKEMQENFEKRKEQTFSKELP